MRIDVDTHVDETDATWAYMEQAELRYRPLSVDPGGPTQFISSPNDKRHHRIWLKQDGIRIQRTREDAKQGTTIGTRTLTDIDQRLRHMDEMEIDVQVLYSTFFIPAQTTRADEDLALCRSYNRWIAEATEKAQGRLRWIAIPPLLSIDKAVEEIRWAKDHGACGILKKGFELDRPSSDPYFFPVYEEAAKLDMPICIHTGTGDPSGSRRFPGTLNAICAFTELAEARVADQIPNLRVGWVECGASWVPYLVNQLGKVSKRRPARGAGYQMEEEQSVLATNRFYVACDITDDLPYILGLGAEDNLMVGTDYGHNDTSSQLYAHDVIEEMGKREEIPAVVARKIVDDNPRRFYGL